MPSDSRCNFKSLETRRLPTIGGGNSFYLSEDLITHLQNIANKHSKGNGQSNANEITFAMRN